MHIDQIDIFKQNTCTASFKKQKLRVTLNRTCPFFTCFQKFKNVLGKPPFFQQTFICSKSIVETLKQV